MNFDDFLKDRRLKFPKDSHSIFPASNYHWLNYSVEKMMEVWSARYTAAEIGTRMHELAKLLIELKQPLADEPRTLNMYVNDAIRFGMVPEKQLRYSEEFRGTCDAIGIDGNVLRIHDLKTGTTKASIKQLYIYAALFCLDSGCKPSEFEKIELCIYQNNDVISEIVGVEEILPIMDKIVTVDAMIRIAKENIGWL